jgi:hypothetical protein
VGRGRHKKVFPPVDGTIKHLEFHPEIPRAEMFTNILASISLLASIATAHFSIQYPQWRGDSFATGASQWIYPCTPPRSIPNFTN